MGVPHFFKYLVESYPNIVFNVSNIEEIDHLCFDTNGLIHPCAAKIKKNNNNDISKNDLEEKIINEVVKYMKFLITKTNPQKSVYVSIDGPAPRAKMHQQRSRRFKSAAITDFTKDLQNQFNITSSSAEWDTNAITPGTEFMDKLNKKLVIELKRFKQEFNIEFILSDSNVPCEGEHKIINYIRKSKLDEDDSIAIYGLDADLIFLSLVLNRPNMLLLREHMLMKGKGNNSNNILFREYDEIEYDYLSIDILKKYFHQEVNTNTDTNYNVDNLINDFIFICFLIGNDFLPNMNCIEIGYGGLDKLLEYYYELLKTEKQHLVLNKKINIHFLKNLFKKLSENEKYLFSFNFQQRKKKYHKFQYKPDENLSEKENQLKENLHNFECVTKKQYDNIKLGIENYQSRFYNHYFHIDTENNEEFNFHINELCNDYLKSLFWNFEYYFVGVKDFEWFYPHPKTPLAADIYNFMIKNNELDYKFTKTNPPKPSTQLLMVLPPQSSGLLPKNYQNLMKIEKSPIIQYYPSVFCYDMINKKFLHECYPYLPIIDYHYLQSVLSSVKLTKDEQTRNTFHKDLII